MTDALQMRGVDFHCHLDLYPDHEAVIRRAESARIYTLTVTTTPQAWTRNFELTRGTRYVRAALGLHPQLVAERGSELALWERHLSEARYVGEVGLDGSARFSNSLRAQRGVFRTVLERCAEAGGKILSVHSLRSVPIVLDMVEEHLPRDRGVVVLHWFTGSKAEARRAAALGCYFSVNAEMTRSDRGRALVSELPLDRILTETDGPFTAVQNRPAEPADVRDVVEAIARVKNVTIEAIIRTVTANLHRILVESD